MLGIVFLLLFAKLAVTQIPFDPIPLPSIWSFGQKMDLYVYANNEPLQNRFDDEKELVTKVESITFGEEFKAIHFDTNLMVDLREPPLYLHIHLIKAGIHPDPLKSPFDVTNSIYRRHPLIRSMKRPARKVKLLEKQQSQLAEDTNDSSEVPYWYPEVVLNLVNFADPIPFSTFPAHIRRLIYADRIRKAFFPIIYANEFWELRGKRKALQAGPVKQEMPLRIHFSTTTWARFNLMAHFHQAIRDYEAITGFNREFENAKKMMLETAPWLIVLTVVITLLHILFDFLAFKHDIQFWKKKKDNLKGLSVRGVLINSVFQLIIFGYLLDNESSLMITASVGIGAMIEIWKITRVLEVHWKPIGGGVVWIPQLRDRASYAKSKTREYDQIAVRYLTIGCIPLLVAYSLWSLKYELHKSWYSWILRSLVGFVYTFGFISMTPQLFINYKLKSVAHMPWKAFIYKTLSTFIDDLFAFVISMPWMHRLACLRDDVLFFVYLYQLWAYPVDKKRKNEFNQSFIEEEEDKEESESKNENNESAAIRKRKVKQN